MESEHKTDPGVFDEGIDDLPLLVQRLQDHVNGLKALLIGPPVKDLATTVADLQQEMQNAWDGYWDACD